MRPLRVVFVAPFGVCRRGTTLARVIPLAEALAARGHLVRVVVPDWDCSGLSPRWYQVGSAEIVHLHEPGALRRIFSLRLLRQTLDAALAFKPDIVHCFKPIGYSGAAAMVLGARGRPAGWRGVLAVDADDLEGSEGWATAAGRPPWQATLLDWQERAGIECADLITAASKVLVGRSKRLRHSREAVCYLPNAVRVPALPAVPPSDSGRDGGPSIILYTRFNEFGVVRGADLLAAVLVQAPRARLDIVGDGRRQTALEFLVRLRKRGVLDRVTWHGFLRSDQLSRALTAAGVAIWLFDNTPINRARSPAKLLELLAHGNAIVAESVGEVPRLVASAAHTVPAACAPGLVRTAAHLLADEGERKRLRELARSRAETHCTWPHRAATVLHHYYT